MCFCLHMSTNDKVDLRQILDPARWNASEELKARLRIPLERKAADVIHMNLWIANRTRRNFGSEQQSC